MARKAAGAPSPSKERLLDAAIALMRRSGLSGAGINDIVKESGAPRGSIYYFFPDGKRQIVSEALALYGKRGAAVWDELLADASAPTDKIRALFRSIAERVERGKYRQSCAAGAACLDLDADLEVVRLAIERTFNEWIKVLERHFPFPDPAKQRSFAGLILTVVEGAFIRARAEQTTKPFDEAASWLADIVAREAHTRGSTRPVQRKER